MSRRFIVRIWGRRLRRQLMVLGIVRRGGGVGSVGLWRRVHRGLEKSKTRIWSRDVWERWAAWGYERSCAELCGMLRREPGEKREEWAAGLNKFSSQELLI